MNETTGASAGTAPGTADTPNPEGGPLERLERKGQDAADGAGAASGVGGDGTGGSVNTDDASAAGPGPTAETSKEGGA